MQSYIRLYKLIYETKSYIKLYKGKQNAKSIYIIIREKTTAIYIKNLTDQSDSRDI